MKPADHFFARCLIDAGGKRRTRVPGLAQRVRHGLRLIALGALTVTSWGQSNPAPQSLPYAQDFGTAAFTTLPPGVGAWNGLNGGTVNSATAAAASVPTADATLAVATTAQTTGGSYGYAVGGNARYYVQTSSNATNGANQLVLALNATGWGSINLGYAVEIISAQPRTVGVLCQYRVGTSGAWTNLTPTSGLNPFSQAGGTTGVKTSPQIVLPAAADNQPVVQIRWAMWRGTESGNSSGIAVDGITVSGTPISAALSASVAPGSISEAAGANAALVTVTRTGDLAAALPVTLAINDPSEAAYDGPNPQDIPAGQTSTTFAIRAVDDQIIDSTQTVTLTASAPGATGAMTSLAVLDDEDANSPPAGYYDAANGLIGTALKAALKTIASPADYQTFAYANTYAPLRSIYEDPGNTANVVTVYSATSIGKNTVYYPGGPSGDTSWSREHIWPSSFGLDPGNVDPGSTGGDAGPDFTDLFNLRPCLQTVNNLRGNLYYDETSGAGTVPALAPLCSFDVNSWEPRPDEKGDLARTIFYMATRYDGTDANTLDLEIGNLPSAATGRFANLSTLLRWHEEDPVSTEERQRNQNIFANWQRNRNPFIDRPEYVALVWGTVRQSKLTAAVTEGGAGDSYAIRLASQPTADVTVNLSAAPAGQVSITPAILTFTASNWDQAQTVTLAAVNDTVHEATLTAAIQHAIVSSDSRYAALAPGDVVVTVTDDDPVIAPTPLPVSYGGPWDTLPTGFLGAGLGSPYAGSLGGDTGAGSAKFDSTGDQLTVGFNSAPATLSYQLKGNPSAGTATSGTFVVQHSSDGVNFTTLRTITNKDNADAAYNDPLPMTARYVAFIYSDKISGNLQFDKLNISAAPPYQAWAAGYGLTGSNADPTGDFDLDGMANLADYGLGGSPIAPDRGPRLPGVERIAGKLRLTVTVRASDPALSVTAETTADLTNPGSWTTSGVDRLTGVDQAGVPVGFERVVFEAVDASSFARYLRLRFSLN